MKRHTRNIVFKKIWNFRIFLFMAFLLLSFNTVYSQQHSRTYLVCVGISDYPKEENDLRFPVKDASDIYTLYKKNGVHESVLLTDNTATKAQVLKAMNQVYSQATSNDIADFYFGGHGIMGSLMLYDDNLPYHIFRKAFAQCKAKTKIIFIDACHAGSLRENKRSGTNDTDNVVVFLSSRTNELSGEQFLYQNGYFSHCLLKALRGKADQNRDKVITARELFEYTSKETKRLSKNAQHPVMWGNFDDHMQIINWKK